jgi:hypothetical protein
LVTLAHAVGETDRIFSIGNLFFDNVDEKEKAKYTDKNPDVYEGYKIRKLWVRL